MFLITSQFCSRCSDHCLQWSYDTFEVLEAVVTKRRNKTAASNFLKKLMKRRGCAEEIVTNLFASYKAALRDLGALEKQLKGP